MIKKVSYTYRYTYHTEPSLGSCTQRVHHVPPLLELPLVEQVRPLFLAALLLGVGLDVSHGCRWCALCVLYY